MASKRVDRSIATVLCVSFLNEIKLQVATLYSMIDRDSFRRMGKGGCEIILTKKMGGKGSARDSTPGMLPQKILNFIPSEIVCFQTQI